MPASRVLVIGGGVIGLTLAWQLRRRSLAVTVADPALASPLPSPSQQASRAAAGMLAVEDPYNPPELLPFSRLSRALYDELLADLHQLTGQAVPFQTQHTQQRLPDGTFLDLPEQSLDPRQLTAALRLAVERTGVALVAAPVQEHLLLTKHPAQPPISGLSMGTFDTVVYATGAQPLGKLLPPGSVVPLKGQMLRLALPPSPGWDRVYRAEHLYVVPRLHGQQAGTALIGATLEHAGFDPSISPVTSRALRQDAAESFPALAAPLLAERLTPEVESWAGFRPATPDGLPLLGELQSPGATPFTGRRFVSTGHLRNGILLAPVSAVLLAALIQGETPALPTEPFAPARFARAPAAVPA